MTRAQFATPAGAVATHDHDTPVRVGVVIPTIDGRDDLLAQTMESYRAQDGAQVTFAVVRGAPTIGEGWAQGIIALSGSDVDYVALSADDVLHNTPTALANAVACAVFGYVASPRIVNVDGSLHSCGTFGGGMLLPDVTDGMPCVASPFPVIGIRDAEAIAPRIPPIHYYADDAVAHLLRLRRRRVIVCRRYELTHLEGVRGRDAMVRRAMADRQTFLESCASDGIMGRLAA